MEIREYTDADFPQVEKLWQACGLTRPWNDPRADLDLAGRTETCVVLVGVKGGTILASTMAGFDGHRGWLYYVAVRPDVQGHGFGRAMVDAAEDRLRAWGCPKVELIVRAGNERVLATYSALGYAREDRVLMSKWLIPPPAPQTDTVPRLLEVTITYLDMTSPPRRAPKPPPHIGTPVGLQRVHAPTVSYYRYLQHTVGDPWLWWERRTLSDAAVAEIIQDSAVELYVLTVGAVPAGFVELDFRAMPGSAEIAYFGLLPDFIGRGLGPYLLDWAIDCAWNRDPAPGKLAVNTCTLDHPSALGGYQRAGFEVVGRETKKVPDPVAAGHVPATVRVLSPGY
jgi:ribosomal protein S18 acetylase RimI-like enzyme